MNDLILIWGIISASVWLVVVYVNYRKSPLGWLTPTFLFGGGLLMFYIIPSIYWQFRPWSYNIPYYFGGLHLVLAGAALLSFFFIINLFNNSFFAKYKKLKPVSSADKNIMLGSKWWLILLPIAIGFIWRGYLFSLGWQARFERTMPAIFGSASLALIVTNFGTYFPACYYALVLIGNKNQKKVGIVIWIIDGLLRVYSLHRYEVLLFIFHSLIFFGILRIKLSKKIWISIAVSCILFIIIFGQIHNFTGKYLTGKRQYLSLGQTAEAIGKTSENYFSSGKSKFHGSQDRNPILRSIDDFMFRLFDARSASAVMMNIPNIIPFYNGKTFYHILFTFIPRYFYPSKPSLADIHFITIRAMPNDSGINPLGTVAEFYLNFGFVGVFFGGLICFLICKWGDGIILKKIRNIADISFVCTYPFLADLFWSSNFNFTQRICEGLRVFLVAGGIMLLLKITTKKHAARKMNFSESPVLVPARPFAVK